MKIFKKNIWSRAINRIHTIIATKFHERKWGEDKNRVKYMFFPKKEDNNNTNILAVCFPAFAGKGAKYNYVRTLHEFNIHKLFLLDDIGGDDKGNYLIKKEVEENVKQLILNIIKEYKPKKLIFFGSSKGGYSALYYSLLFKNIDVCIAAPQYYLTDYLTRERKFENLNVILGDNNTDKDKDILNNKLKEAILNSQNLPNSVYIHYSKNEHTYKEHIEDLLKDLNNKNVPIIEDVEYYSNHMDLVFYFPKFLKSSVQHLIKN